jgi:hypothetical protein
VRRVTVPLSCPCWPENVTRLYRQRFSPAYSGLWIIRHQSNLTRSRDVLGAFLFDVQPLDPQTFKEGEVIFRVFEEERSDPLLVSHEVIERSFRARTILGASDGAGYA